MVATERVPVRFEGPGAGAGPLSWGQRELWGAMQRQNTWMPLHHVRPLPAGTGIDAVAADLRFLMSHYPTMRTRLRFGPDGPTQVVAGSGEISLEVYDTTGADPAELADQVRHRYKHTDYDFAGEWPVRMAAIRHRGALTHQVLVVCHLVLDAAGAAKIQTRHADRDAGRDAGRDAVTGGVAGPAPLEQAEWQRSEAGQRHCRAALKHWERQLRDIPPRRFAAPASRTRPRYWQALFRSPALDLAVQAIAAGLRVDAAPVRFACYAVALSRVTGTNPVVTRVIASNRYRPELAETVSPVSQPGLLVVEVAGLPFGEVVNRVQRRLMATYKYAYCDPVQLAELVARLGRERGEPLDLGCLYNDRRRPAAPADSPAPTPDQVRAALPESSFVWQHKQDDKPYEPLFVHIEEMPGGQAVTVNGDTHYLDPGGMEACLRGMEEVAAEAAFDLAGAVPRVT